MPETIPRTRHVPPPGPSSRDRETTRPRHVPRFLHVARRLRERPQPVRTITIAIEDADVRLDDLARRAQEGERVVPTWAGQPIADAVPHASASQPEPPLPEPAIRRGGIDYAAMRRYLDERGIEEVFAWVAPDFDDPLPEDFLLRPLP